MASPYRLFVPSFFLLAILSTTHLCVSARIDPNSRPLTRLNPVAAGVADVHDLLPQYGLPKGLVPNNVASYTITNDGAFEILLDRPCYVHFDQLVYYEKRIRGKLSYGSVTGVSGIQAKKLFIWVSVTGMKAEPGSDWVEFYVGSLSQKLPAKQFDEIPECRSSACLETHPESM